MSIRVSRRFSRDVSRMMSKILELQNIEILTTAIRKYQGTLLVLSHDEQFLEEIGVESVTEL